ncbi:MAG: MATE family efflux transporter [Oscillospiraceae bacterium]
MEEEKPLFTRKALQKLIIPLIIEQLLAMTIGMADTVMVTSVGEAAVSGVALVDAINILLIQVFAALATGGAVVASQYLGRKDEKSACTSAKQLFYAAGGVAVLIMTFALLFRGQILSLIFGSVEADVMDSAMSYFFLTALSFPGIAIYNCGAALFRSMGNSKVSMFTALGVNLLNIGGNAIFIFGFDMGAAGAGLATLISRSVAGVAMLILICRKKNIIHIDRIWRPEFRSDMLVSILRVGIPNGMENGIFQVGKLLLQRLIVSFGTAAIAANVIANNVSSVVDVSGNAIALALITVVGQCMGAHVPEQAVTYTRKLMKIVYLCMGALNIVMFIFATPLVGLFALSAQSADMAVEVLRWCAVFSMTIWPTAFVLPNALRAAGDAKFTMVVSISSMFLCRIGLSYLFCWVFQWGLLGVWLAMFMDWVVRAIIFEVRFRHGTWKHLRVI